MSTRYRLPEILGGAECVFHSKGYQDGCWIVELVDTMPGMRLELESSALVAVKPPLPDEPPVGSVVLVCGEAAQRFEDNDLADDPLEHWASVGTTQRWTWEQLNEIATGPVVLLTPPVAPRLPWRGGPLGIYVDLNGLGGGPHKVVVAVRGHSAHVTSPIARDTARALWTAADAAEARP